MNLNEHLKEELKNPEFAKEFKALEPEFEIIRQDIIAHANQKTWDNYKDHVKKIDPEIKKDIEQVENLASLIGEMLNDT